MLSFVCEKAAPAGNKHIIPHKILLFMQLSVFMIAVQSNGAGKGDEKKLGERQECIRIR
jgi:hypothetical protein